MFREMLSVVVHFANIMHQPGTSAMVSSESSSMHKILLRWACLFETILTFDSGHHFTYALEMHSHIFLYKVYTSIVGKSPVCSISLYSVHLLQLIGRVGLFSILYSELLGLAFCTIITAATQVYKSVKILRFYTWFRTALLHSWPMWLNMSYE